MDDRFENLTTSTTDNVTTIRVDRVDSRNSLDIETLDELSTAINGAMAAGETSTIVVGGEGDDTFISGADIGDFHNQDSLWFIRDFRRAFGKVEEAIESGPNPVVVAADGVTFGGGLELSLMCDLVYASESTVLGFPESQLGGIPGVGGTQRLAAIVGYLKAKELVLTGQSITSEEAASLGIVNDVFPDDTFQERLDDITHSLADGAPYAQWFGKEVINRSRSGIEDGLALEAALGAVLFETPDIHEGFEAFLERRDSSFSGWDGF